MTRLLTIALCAAAVAMAAGCGGGGDQSTTAPAQSASATARSYVDASNRGDAAKICELYSQELINKLAASDCEDFVQEQTSGAATKLTLGSVHQSGDQATVAILSSGESGNPARLTIQLQRQKGEWKVSSLGPGTGNGGA
jgi:ketosteroid isomerase-like protein